MVLLLIFWYSNSAPTEKLEYYQVIELFDKGQISEYELNIGSGALTYTLNDGTKGKYSVPNVSMFVNDIHETVVEFNRANPETPIKYDYASGNSYSFWLQIIPVIFCAVLIIFGGSLLMKKMVLFQTYSRREIKPPCITLWMLRCC